MDDAALLAEIQADPLGLGYAPHVAERRDADVAAILNAPRGTRAVPGSWATARTVLDRAGAPGALALRKLRAFGREVVGGEPMELQALRAAVDEAMACIDGNRVVDGPQGIDLGSATAQHMLEAAVEAGALPQALADALGALGRGPSSRALDLFGAAVSHADVSRVLNGGEK